MGQNGDLKLERESESEACGREGPPMDTPLRNQITTTPGSKFEDSPVFNYINSLSPIKTVKSTRFSQTFNSFSFTSLPSIFTSPHISSLKESRFLGRHSDPSKPEFSTENRNQGGSNEGVIDVVHNSDEQRENFDPGSCIGEASVEPPDECSELAIVTRTLSHDFGSPETNCVSELAGTLGPLVESVQEVSETVFFGSGISNIEPNKDGGGRVWERLVSDASGLLIFDSPNDTERLRTSWIPEFIHDKTNDLENMQVVGGSVGLEQYELENPPPQVGEGHLKEIEASGDIIASTSVDACAAEPSEQIDNEPVSNLHRGIRRRCLVFEMGGGAYKKLLDDSSSSCSSMLSQSYVNIKPNDQPLVPIKKSNDSSRCILPGIGLHLNALARTSNHHTTISHETMTNGQESLNKSLAVTSVERHTCPENGVEDIEGASQVSGYIATEEFNQGSPKKKRRRLENAGESEGCKRCNCKKSKCLKLYCECFAAGVYCVEPCTCQGCFNKPKYEDMVLATRKQIESRNPLAFAPKVIRNSDCVPETRDEPSKTPASARHKRGCNCKKSGCLKKYCECYQGGVGCSINCRCEGCKNAFGRKDGSVIMAAEAELEEEEETETSEKSAVNKSLHKNVIQIGVEQNPDSALTATPLQCHRDLIQLPFSSKSKLQRSSLLSIGSSSGLCGIQKLGNPNFLLHPQPKFEKPNGQEDEMPKILQGTSSPISGVKSASPNSKRVSPPHCNIRSSTGRRSSRKLILQSIPSFPSLTPKH